MRVYTYSAIPVPVARSFYERLTQLANGDVPQVLKRGNVLTKRQRVQRAHAQLSLRASPVLSMRTMCFRPGRYLVVIAQTETFFLFVLSPALT